MSAVANTSADADMDMDMNTDIQLDLDSISNIARFCDPDTLDRLVATSKDVHVACLPHLMDWYTWYAHTSQRHNDCTIPVINHVDNLQNWLRYFVVTLDLLHRFPAPEWAAVARRAVTTVIRRVKGPLSLFLSRNMTVSPILEVPLDATMQALVLRHVHRFVQDESRFAAHLKLQKATAMLIRIHSRRQDATLSKEDADRLVDDETAKLRTYYHLVLQHIDHVGELRVETNEHRYTLEVLCQLRPLRPELMVTLERRYTTMTLAMKPGGVNVHFDIISPTALLLSFDGARFIGNGNGLPFWAALFDLFDWELWRTELHPAKATPWNAEYI
jgi:hypothetical protein